MSLTPIQARAAQLVALGYTQVEAAKRSGCSERSIRRWADENPEFAAACTQSPDAITDQTPVEVLRSLLASDRDDMRLRAATKLHEIEQQQSNGPDHTGATYFVAVHDGHSIPHEVPTIQRDLPPGSSPWLVLHLESAPLPPKPYTPRPDAVLYAATEE